MKKIIIIILLVIVALWAWSYYQKNVVDYSMEEILPKDVFFYLKVNDADYFLKSLNKNKTWQVLRGLDYDKLTKNIQLSFQQKIFLKIVQADFSKMDSRLKLLLSKIFSDNVALAIYPPQNDYDQSPKTFKQYLRELGQDILANVVLIAKVPFDMKTMDILSGPLKKYQDNFQIEITPYKDRQYIVLTLPDTGQRIYYTHLRKYVMASIDEKIIKNCIDTFLRKSHRLSDDVEFVKVSKKYFKKSDLMGYINVASFWDFFEKNSTKLLEFASQQISKDNDQEVPDLYVKYYQNLEKKVKTLIERGRGFKTFGFSFEMADVSSLNSVLFLDENPLNKQRIHNESCEIGENESIHFIPQDVIGYQWNNCFNFEEIWKEYKTAISKNNKSSTALNKITFFEKTFKIDIENDLVPALGHEMGGYFKGIDIKEKKIFPELLFFISAGNKEKFVKLFDSLDNVPFFTLQKQDYEGFPIKYIETPAGKYLKPSFCRLDDYLLIGLTDELVKSSIDAYVDKTTSLLDNSEFAMVNKGLTNKNDVVKFVLLKKASEKLVDALQWANDFFIRKEMAREAFKKGTENRLEDIVEKISVEEQEISGNELRIKGLEEDIDEIAKGEIEGNIEDKESDISFLEENIQKRRKKIEELDEQREELRGVLRKYNKKAMLDKRSRQILLDEVAIPVLKSFKSIHSVGVRKTHDEYIRKSYYLFHAQ